MNRGSDVEESSPEPGTSAPTAGPASIDDPRVVRDVEMYCAALRRGERPDRRRLLEKYPGQEKDLGECLDGLELIQRIDPDLIETEAARIDGRSLPQRGVLGDFQIVREIGCGGMGVVYEAEQISLGRRVALKVLPFASMLDGRHLQRFQNEARAAASLHHPNIVAVYAVGCERGVHFYAMERIEGQSLAQVIHELRRLSASLSPPESLRGNTVSQLTQRLLSGDLASASGTPAAESPLRDSHEREPQSQIEPATTGSEHPLSSSLSDTGSASRSEFFRTVARLGIQAAEALAHAHELGVVHRDIKPSNLLLDARGHLWITDFGLAQTQTATNLTLTGDLVGTLRYMSPEQTRGRGSAVDGRTDIYSLGVTLYELLTLTSPFEGEERPAILRQILEGRPKRLRQRDVSVPRDLETIVLTAMATEPNRRFATAQELADDLRRFLEHRPIRARRPTLVERSGKWVQRNQSLVLVATLFLILTSVGSSTGLFLISNARNDAVRQRDLANDRQRLADDSRRVAEQRTRELREQVYAADIRLAHQAWKRADLQWAIDFLERYRPLAGEADLRGFEWYYLWALCHPQQRTLIGHVGDVHCVTFSADGRTLATAGQDGTARVWDVANCTARFELAGSRGEVTSVAFSPDGKLLASTRQQGVVLVSDVATGRDLVTLPGIDGDVYTVAFSPDGRWLATGGDDTTVKLWNTSTWKQERALVGHESHIHGLAFSPDSKTLATGSNDETVRLWDVAAGTSRTVLAGHGHEVLSVAFSPDGRQLAAASANRNVFLWDANSGKLRFTLRGHFNRVNQVAFSANGRLLASASKDGSVRLWDAATAAELGVIRGHVGRSWCVAFSPDGTLATSGADGSVRLWDPGASQEFRRLILEDDLLQALTFDAGGMMWVCMGRSIQCWDIRSGGVRISSTSAFDRDGDSSNPISAAAFFRDGRTVATALVFSGILDIRDVRLGTLLHRMIANVPNVESLPNSAFSLVRQMAVSPDGRVQAYVCVAETAVTVRLCDVASGRELSSFPLECVVHALEFSPDGATLYAGCSDHTIKRWDVTRGQPLATIQGHENEVYSLAFSGDGRLLASGSTGRRIRLWDPATGKQVGILIGHADNINTLAFTPDGRTLASGSRDGSVKLWSVSSGRELLTFDVPASAWMVDILAFSRDGRVLAAGIHSDADPREIRVWSAR